MIKSLDATGDGKISFDEFCKLFDWRLFAYFKIPVLYPWNVFSYIRFITSSEI
jgi:hypothetical protein